MTDFPSQVVPKPDVDPRRELLERIACPLQARNNPHEGPAAERANAWYVGIWGDTPWSRKVRAAKMEQLVSGFYPDAGEEGLTLATRYLLWAFSVDDTADETDRGREVVALAQLFTRFEEILRGAPAESESPLSSALADLVPDFRALLSSDQYERFVAANLAYFGAMLWEANNRQCSWVPDEATYQLLRPAAGAVPPFWELIEALTGARTRGSEELSAQLEELSRLAGRLVCWHNDLLSYEKERAQGDLHNLCIVFERHRRCSPEEALSAAIRFTNEEMARFVELSERSQRGVLFESSRRYVQTLESMVATTLLWTSRSLRYGSEPGRVELAAAAC